MTFDQLKQKAHELPLIPGVYIMHNKAGDIIYIGKAKALKNRVSQYFANLASHSPKTVKMVSNIDDFETIYAKTEFDALLLESTLIKKHKPKYNILLKDDKGYPYVRLGREQYPAFSIVSRKATDGARYFGPYGGRGAAKSAIKIISDTFLLPSCTRKFPRDIGKQRPCLNLHMQKCCGVCTGNVSALQYDELLHQACLVLDGKSAGLEQSLRCDMESRAEALDFEGAALCRDRLRAVERLRLGRVVAGAASIDTDVLGFASRGTRGCVAALSYCDGNLMDKKLEFFDGLSDNDAADALESFIKQHYGAMDTAPKELYLSHEIEDSDTIEEFLTSLRGNKSTVLVPQRGDKLRMTALATENAQYELALLETREQKSGKLMELLRETLGIEKTPRRLEAYDISNTAGSEPVASMTVFMDGHPLKKAYKRFKIKEAAGGDDYGAMAEVIGRRLDRATGGDDGFLPLPDVLLVDGGAGQVTVAERELSARGLSIPLFGMVKDEHHRTRALVAVSGGEIGISASPPLFSLIGRIQEETHRVAIDFHHQRRSITMKASQLDGISGLGDNRKAALLEAFGSVSAIKKANKQQLSRVVPKDVAQKIIEKFGEEK